MATGYREFETTFLLSGQGVKMGLCLWVTHDGRTAWWFMNCDLRAWVFGFACSALRTYSCIRIYQSQSNDCFKICIACGCCMVLCVVLFFFLSKQHSVMLAGRSHELTIAQTHDLTISRSRDLTTVGVFSAKRPASFGSIETRAAELSC